MPRQPVFPPMSEQVIENTMPCKLSDRVLTTPASVKTDQHITDETDSGYSSLNVTPKLDAGDELPKSTVIIEQKRQFRRVKIGIFQIDPPPEVQTRFRDLKLFINKPLYHHLFGDGTPSSSVSITLRYMGKDTASAKPVLLVMCRPELAKKASAFFKQPHIKEQCQPNGSDFTQISFQTFVYNKAPLVLARSESTSIWLSQHGLGARYPSFCGVLVRASVAGRDRYSTIGGLVEITGSWGTIKYGMTVEHFMHGTKRSEEHSIESLSIHEDPVYDDAEGALTLYHNQAVNDDVDTDIEDQDNIFADDVVIDLDLAEQENGQASIVPIDNEESDVYCALPREAQLFGRAVDLRPVADVDHGQTQTRLDWALIELSSTIQIASKGNDIDAYNDDHIPLLSSESGFHAGLGAGVIVCAGMSGRLSGSLASTTASYTVGCSTQLVEVYILHLDNHRALKAGDCGSWVLNPLTGSVYGQVVAGDALNSYYVVPLGVIFDEMKERLGDITIHLPQTNSQPSQSHYVLPAVKSKWSGLDSGYGSAEQSPTPVLDEIPTVVVPVRPLRHSGPSALQQPLLLRGVIPNAMTIPPPVSSDSFHGSLYVNAPSAKSYPKLKGEDIPADPPARRGLRGFMETIVNMTLQKRGKRNTAVVKPSTRGRST